VPWSPDAAPRSPPPAELFISYASPDLARAEALHTRLVAAGLSVWFDKTRLNPGCEWHKEIERGCKAAWLILPLLTPYWQKSERTKYETYASDKSLATPRNKRVIWRGPWLPPRHGRPPGRAEGAPEDKLRPAIHDFAARTKESRGWPAGACPRARLRRDPGAGHDGVGADRAPVEALISGRRLCLLCT
jgi:hypothetical protein